MPEQHHSRASTVGIILAGGQGARMGGKDKGLQLHKGKPLIEHAISRLEYQCADIVISANRNLSHYQAYGYPIITDHQTTSDTDYQGPMAGIAACINYLLSESSANYALISSCDTPAIPLDLGSRFHTSMENSGVNVAVAKVNGHRQNLHCLIRRELWPSLIKAFNDGERAMHRWLKSEGDLEVDFSDQADAFNNLNTLSQIAKINQ